ncbi:MAG: hypothetical protein CM1200mP18_10390 [Gammaproteobacteria bacterium]|nr:MAG: hypothetical protein CM1200mP18_10390 [Gammaproteobacteria bacterium]
MRYLIGKLSLMDRHSPQVTWGTSPEMVIPIDGIIPDPQGQADETRRDGWVRALEYMGLESGNHSEVKVDKVLLGLVQTEELKT